MKPTQSISMDFWKEELSALVASAKTEEEIVALSAFEKALSPYLDKPGALRTLLGKIQASVITGTLDAIMVEGEFKNLDELKAILSNDMNVIVA